MGHKKLHGAVCLWHSEQERWVVPGNGVKIPRYTARQIDISVLRSPFVNQPGGRARLFPQCKMAGGYTVIIQIGAPLVNEKWHHISIFPSCQRLSAGELWVGRQSADPLRGAYLDWMAGVLDRALEGKRRSGSFEPDDVRDLQQALTEIRQMKKEWENWQR